MDQDAPFRWLFIGVFVTMMAMSVSFRRRARKTSEVIPRAREGGRTMLLRLAFAAPLYLSVLAYMINPRWMEWSSLPLPRWVRWSALAVCVGVLPLVYWVLTSLGSNISETVLTKSDHRLVTHGPYRWVRHPLYAAATIAFAALGVVAANGFILGMSLVVVAGMALFVIPMEEARLVEKFGDAYREYMRHTGRLTPRPGRSR